MTNKTKAYIKIILGILLIVLSFPSLVSSFLIVIGGIIVHTTDAHKFGQAIGNFAFPLVISLSGLWLLISGYKQKKSITISTTATPNS